MSWEDVKRRGSIHYKGNNVELLDLFRDSDILWEYAICNIIKYIWRNRYKQYDLSIEDMEKAKHYIDILIEMKQGKINNSLKVEVK